MVDNEWLSLEKFERSVTMLDMQEFTCKCERPIADERRSERGRERVEVCGYADTQLYGDNVFVVD